MKFLQTVIIFFLTPLIFCAFLLSVVVPLFIQHFFSSKKESSNVVEYPYLTSWEEAA